MVSYFKKSVITLLYDDFPLRYDHFKLLGVIPQAVTIEKLSFPTIERLRNLRYFDSKTIVSCIRVIEYKIQSKTKGVILIED